MRIDGMKVLIYEKKNHIARITLNRPEAHNALDAEMIVALSAAWKDYYNDKEMRCAIITGAGNKSYCAGADLGKLIPLITGARQPESDADRTVLAYGVKAALPLQWDIDAFKPVVAAINGYAIGGGLELLYGTDIRIACPEAKFGLPEVKWALFPSGGTVLLPRQLSYVKAMEMLLTGNLISAQEALDYGLINRVVPREKLLEEAERYAVTISKNGPLAVAAIKESVIKLSGLSLEEALKKESGFSVRVIKTNDVNEGSKAFIEKREPVFRGE
jgi:enoyl-CoA hydratase